MVQNATLDDDVNNMTLEEVNRLRNPPQAPIDIESRGVRHSISMYLALEHASQAAYEQICRSTQLNFTESPICADILSFHAVEKKIAEYTGVEYIEHNMCLDSCAAFTGPFADLEHCPVYGKSRWDQNRLHASNGRVEVAAKKFTTIPIGPQLQAQYRDPQSARDMRYLYERTQQVLAEICRTGEIPNVIDVT